MIKKYLFSVLVIVFSFVFVNGVQAAEPTTYKAAILMVNFPDNLTHIWSMQTAGNTLTEIGNFHNENSYGNVIIEGGVADVYGVYTISRTCDASGITAQARDAAMLAGVDLSSYDILIPVGSFDCNWKGVYVPGAVAAIPNKQVIAHEMAHLFGLSSHANFLNCGLVPLANSGCTNMEYNDPYSVMSNGMMFHMSAYEKMIMQYFKPENIVNVTADGDYMIEPIELNTTLPQVLQIPVSGGSLQIEYRKWIGFDSLLPNSILTGALVHKYNQLLDMTPTSPSSEIEPVLTAGNIFTDPNNVEVTTLSAGPDNLSVRVHFLQPVVDIKINNSDGPVNLTAPANFGINISASVANCDKSGSWSGALNGATYQQLTNVIAGTYTYTVTCTNPAGSISDSIIVNVTDPISAPQVLVKANNTPTILNLTAPGNYNVSWSATNASYGCVNSGNWSGVGTTSYFQAFNNMPVGNYTYTVTCSNIVGSSVSSVNVIVASPLVISIVNPVNNSVLKGITNVRLDLVNTASVMSTSLFIDNVYSGSFSGNPLTKSWNTQTVADGWHSIKADIAFGMGNIVHTAPVSVRVDNTAPSVPSGLSLTNVTVSDVNLSWNVSSDVSGVAGYYLYRDGVLIATIISGTSYTDAGLTPETTYSYTLNAYDILGNTSVQSAPLLVTTLTPPDVTSPITSITSPAQGSSIPGPVIITAYASDNIGVTQVEIYVDSVLATTLIGEPYIYSQVLNPGIHSVFSKAYDLLGNIGISESVSFTVLDTTAPNTSITAPTQGASVGSPVTITATATDNVGVTQVEIYVDSILRTILTSAPYNYSMSLSLGLHSTYAKAFDLAGNTKTSSIISFTVVDTTAPNVSITAPTNGGTVNRNNTTTIRATATDNVAVTKVEFYVNGVLKGTDTTSSYTYNWSVPSARNVVYTLMAKAYDAKGNTKTHSITVTSK